MRKTGEKEIAAVLKLDGPARFEHFVKRVVDEQHAWGLWSDGWALMDDSEGNRAFPFWPAPEYAHRCRIDSWSSYEVEEIALQSLLDDLLPKLKNRNVRPAVFPTPGGKGVALSVDELAEALRNEMSRYE